MPSAASPTIEILLTVVGSTFGIRISTGRAVGWVVAEAGPAGWSLAPRSTPAAWAGCRLSSGDATGGSPWITRSQLSKRGDSRRLHVGSTASQGLS